MEYTLTGLTKYTGSVWKTLLGAEIDEALWKFPLMINKSTKNLEKVCSLADYTYMGKG